MRTDQDCFFPPDFEHTPRTRPKVEKRVPVIKKASLAVKVATTRIGQLKGQLQERDATIAQLRQDVASSMAEAEKARKRADKLEARFTQVRAQNSLIRCPLLSTCQLELAADVG